MKTFNEYINESMSEKNIIKEMIGLSARTDDKDGWFNYDKGGSEEEAIYNKLKSKGFLEELWSQYQNGINLARIKLLKKK